MKKKLLSMVMALTVCIAALAGCGSSTEGSESSSASTTTVTETVVAESDSGESALLKEIKERGYINVGTCNDAPFCYYDVDTGELKGIDVDIMKGICEKLGIAEVRATIADFPNLLIELNNGNMDMVTDGMYIKQERLEVAYFTDVWYSESEAIITKSDSSFTTKESLSDAVVGAVTGSAFYEMAEQWLADGKIKELVGYENQATAMTAVNTGKIDACVTDGIVAGYTIAQDSSLDLKLMTPYEGEATGNIGAAIRYEDEAFLKEVNDALNEMKEDGTLKAILESYGLTEEYFIGVEEGKTANVK